VNMNYVCLVGQPIAWESHVLDRLSDDDHMDICQSAFLLRVKHSEDIFCTLTYNAKDSEAARIENAKYVVIVGSIVETSPRLHISVCSHYCADSLPSDLSVLEIYIEAMKALYFDTI